MGGSDTGFRSEMQARFGADRLRAGVPLAPLTTFKVGGPADWLLETRSSDEIVAALRIAHLAEPYPPLPKTPEDPDILNVVRTWQFLPDGGLIDE